MHRLPRTLLAVAVLLAFALGACGDENDIASKSPQDVLKETFGPDKPVRSGKLDLRLGLDAALPGSSGPLKLALKGPFSSSGSGKLPRFDFDLNVDAGGQAVAAGAISTGEKGWLKFGGEAFAISEAQFRQFRTLYEQDQKNAAESDNPSLQSLGVDPTRWLADPEKAEEETVGGVETVHVTSKVDVPALLADVNRLLGRADATGAAAATGTTGRVPSKLTDAQRKQIERSVKRTSLDVYTGKEDGTLRRLNIQITFDVPKDAQGGAGGLTKGTLGLDLVISELNEEQRIAAPAKDRPLSDLTQGGVTGAAGAVPAPQAGGDAPADPAAAAPQAGAAPGLDPEYSACVQAAGASVAEIQKCAPLLNGGGGGG